MITRSIQMKQKKSLLEDHCRRSNLQIDGVAKENGEFWDNCEQETNDIFMDKLKIDTEIIIERAHRTKKKADMARQINCKQQTYKHKVRVRQNCKRIRGSDIYINEEETTLQYKKQLWRQVKWLP